MSRPRHDSSLALHPAGARTGRVGGARAWTRRFRAGLVLSLAAAPTLLTGCYTYTRYDVPVTAPAAGTSPEVALEITDRGRVQLADSLGAGVVRIEGRLTGATSDVYQLNVRSVRYLRGDPVRWSGEPLSVPRENVAATYERRFSRTRTLLTAAGVLGGAVALLLATDLIGRGNEDPGRRPLPDPPVDQ